METLLLLNQILALVNTATPAIGAAVKEIKSMNDEHGDMTYEITIRLGKANLTDAGVAFQCTLDQVNAELARLGLPPLSSL